MFIARAVQAGEPLPPYNFIGFPPLPRLSKDIQSVYEANHPGRMKLFDGPYDRQIEPLDNPPSSPFKHELRHDGESSVWTFFWWSILASPEKEGDFLIDSTNWSGFAPPYHGLRRGLPDGDNRDTILNNLIERKKNFLHPGYGDLLSLFSDIAKAIKLDYHWADGKIRRSPDFVHELLQRIILNFVVENDHEPVMDKKKSYRNRAPVYMSSTRHLSTRETDARRSKSIASTSSSKGRKRKSKETTPISTPSTPPVADDGAVSNYSSDSLENPDDDDTKRLVSTSI
jgi:hypothetical protein